jgi:hypothetical protein
MCGQSPTGSQSRLRALNFSSASETVRVKDFDGMPIRFRGSVARPALRYFLEEQRKSSEKSGDKTRQFLLMDAIEALKYLDHGEVLAIFTPVKTSAKGAKPYTAKKLRVAAHAFVDLLCAKGYTKGKALGAVAGAYFRTIDGLKKWPKTGSSEVQSIAKKIRKMKNLDIDGLLKELEGRAGV